MMSVTEPMTMLIDYVLAAVCFHFAFSISSRSREAGKRKTGLWVVAFVVTAFAALAGGTAHGFRVPLGESWTLIWSVTVWSIGSGSVLLIAAGVHSAFHPDARSEASRRKGSRG